MMQRGPGEGYMAVKQLVLVSWPNAVCRRVQSGDIRAYVIYREKAHQDWGKWVASAKSSREAWNKALSELARRDILR